MCVFVHYGLCVCGQKYIIIIICDRLRKVVPRLNKHDDVIEWNFINFPSLRNEELVAALRWKLTTELIKSMSKSNILTSLIFFTRRQGKGKPLMETLRLHIIAIEPSQYMSSQMNI